VIAAELERLLRSALARRQALIEALHAESSDCYRLFHGVTEGREALTIDRYGPVILVQTWRDAIERESLDLIARFHGERFGANVVWNHRGRSAGGAGALPRPLGGGLADAPIGHELGIAYDVRPRHRGQDPLLFLDMRAGRRWVSAHAEGLEVLNLFAYTCGFGSCAAVAGARSVWNVDFARSALDVGQSNAALNGVPSERFRVIQEDVLPVVRQLAGLPIGVRRGRHGRMKGLRHAPRSFEPRQFDLVILDPPGWSKGPYGAVDIVRDYQGLFKPALLCARPGGVILATNHSARVERDGWIDALRRCAERAGRPIRAVEIITPEADFPSFDDQPPLKIAGLHV